MQHRYIGKTGLRVSPICFDAIDLILSDDIFTECDKVHEEILYPMG